MTVVCAPTGGSTFPIGVTPVTCVATDAHNNATPLTGSDGRGGQCTGTVTVGVPHDQSPQRRSAIGDGPLYNSVTGARQQ